MFENQPVINEPTVKKKSRTLTIIAIVLAVIVLIVAGVYVWYLITDRNYKGEVNNITISNITSNSATLSWTTYTKYPGEIEISTDNKFFILSFLQNNKKFYDTRDIEEISQGKYELIDKGKYYSHHVTIYGLDPETEYNYRFNTGIFTTSLGGSIKTFPIRESIKTPNPIYGYVFDQYGEIYDDILVKAYVKNPTSGVSQNLTSVTDNGTGWSMDIGTIYSITGQEMTFEKDWTLVVEAIGPYAKKTIEVPNTNIKPVDNIVLEKLSFIETENIKEQGISQSSTSQGLIVNRVFADACSQIEKDDCEAFASIGCEVRSGRCVMRAAPINPPAENKCGDGECDTGENCAQDCTCNNDKCDDLDDKNGCEEECEDGRQNCQWQYFCGPFIEVDKSNKLCNIDDTAKKTLGNRGCDRCDLLLSIDACNQVGEGLNLGCTWDYTKGVCKSKTSITNEIPAKKYFCDDTRSSISQCKDFNDLGEPANCGAPKLCENGHCIENPNGDDYCTTKVYNNNTQNNTNDSVTNPLIQEDLNCENNSGNEAGCKSSGCFYNSLTKKCTNVSSSTELVHSVTSTPILVCSQINSIADVKNRIKMCNTFSDLCTLSKNSQCVSKEIVAGSSCAKLVKSACDQRPDCIYSGEPAKCRSKSISEEEFANCAVKNESSCISDEKCKWERNLNKCINKSSSILTDQQIDCDNEKYESKQGLATPECKFENTNNQCTTQYKDGVGYECVSINEIANYGYQGGAGICVAINNAVFEINQGPGTGQGYSHNDAYGCAFDIVVYNADITAQVQADMKDCYTTQASTGCTAIITNNDNTQFELGHLDEKSCLDIGLNNKGSCDKLITGNTGDYSTGAHLHYGMVGVSGQECDDGKVEELIESFPGSEFFSCDKKLEYAAIDTSTNGAGGSLMRYYTDLFSKLNHLSNNKVNAQENSNVENFDPGFYTFSQGNEVKKALYVSSDTQVLLFDDSNGNNVKDEGEVLLSIDGLKSLGYTIEQKSSSQMYTINKGWNLVHFPYVFEGEESQEIKTASDLMYIMNAQGADVTNISTYRDGNFIMFTTRLLEDGSAVEFGEDFNIIPGEAYFLLSYKNAEVEITGMQIDGSLEIPLQTGWNLVGIFNSEKENYSAFDILSQMNTNGISSDTISKWESGKYVNVVKIDDTEYGYDYKLFPQQGYFVRVLSQGTNSFSPK